MKQKTELTTDKIWGIFKQRQDEGKGKKESRRTSDVAARCC